MKDPSTSTVEEYLAGLPEDRRAVVATLRDLILLHLPSGYQEAIRWGMICYEVPLERYPSTYNGQPLLYIALAAQKRYYSLYLMDVYGDPEREAWLRQAYAHAGKTPNMGKSCVRFRRLDDLPLEAIAQAVAHTTPEALVARYEASRTGRKA